MGTVWKITFTNPEGEQHTTEFLGTDEKPTENEVAITLRNQLLSNVVLVDRTRGQGNHTVALLEHYGYKIVGIERDDAAD